MGGKVRNGVLSRTPMNITFELGRIRLTPEADSPYFLVDAVENCRVGGQILGLGLDPHERLARTLSASHAVRRREKRYTAPGAASRKTSMSCRCFSASSDDS